MSEDKFVKIKFILQIIQTTGIVVAVLSICLNYYGVYEQHEWNRRQQTLVLINEVNQQLKEIRKPLKEAFPDFYSDNETLKLSKQEAENLFNACSSKPPQHHKERVFTCKARGIAGEYINMLEYISMAYVNHVADRKMVKNVFGGMMVEDFDYFKNFIIYVGDVRKRHAWKFLQDAVADMTKENIPNPGRTGEL